MATYLYGLLLDRNAHLVPAHITGIAGASVRVVSCDRLGALVSSIDRQTVRPELDAVRAHDHALQSVVHHGSTTAATRFGQTFATDEETRRHLRDHGARVEDVLEEFDGCVEMRLLMNPSASMRLGGVADAAVQTPGNLGEGAAYLHRIRAQAVAGKEAAARLGLREALGPVVRAERVEELPKARGIAFAHLVRRQDEASYRDAVGAMPALAAAKLVGPLALYSFAEP